MTEKRQAGGVLVVDDVVENLQLINSILDMEGYRVRFANDGEVALRSIAEETPELVLLDVRMPGLSGFDVCRRLKSQSETRHIPVILVSGSAENSERELADDAGADGYLLKPFNIDQIIDVVRQYASPPNA